MNRRCSAERHPSRRRVEGGSGTVLVLAAVGALALLLVGVLTVVEAVREAHRAAGAADLAALAAAAGPARGGETDCPSAAAVAAPMGARLVQCTGLPDGSVVVGVEVPVRWPVGWAGLPEVVSGTARAGAVVDAS